MPITASQFSSLRTARDRLISCLAVEEAFAVALANYVSLETAIAAANVSNMVERSLERVELEEQRREIDRHLVNLLATGQMFTDHADRLLCRDFGRRSAEKGEFDASLEKQRQALLGFAATEHLRDAVLHQALPVASWTTGGQWVGIETDKGGVDKRNPHARLEHSVSFDLDPSILAGSRDVDPALIGELRQRAGSGGRVPWVPVIREYVEGLSMVLGEVRRIYDPIETSSALMLADFTERYTLALGPALGRPPVVIAVELDEGGAWLSEVPLCFDYDARVSDLRRRHRPMVNLHRRALRG